MADEETTIVENLDSTPEIGAHGESQETQTTGTQETTTTPEPSEQDVAAAQADAALAAEGGAFKSVDDEDEAPAYKPDFKFKASGKEYEIPEAFRSLIKDEKTDKEVKSIFSKAFGADALIEKNKKYETNNANLTSVNQNLTGAIDGLRQLYGEASKPGGNILKFDQWLEKVQIPEEFILKWAVAKVQLMEMPPEQRNAIVAQMDAEKRTNALSQERSQLQGQNAESQARLLRLEFEHEMSKPTMQAYETEFDKRNGKPGAFKETVKRTGELAWLRQKVHLSPDQAIKQVIADYGLTVPDPASAAPSQAASGNPGSGQKPIVQRTTQVIPNVGGKSSQSPLKQKPRTIEDIKKLGERLARGEAI